MRALYRASTALAMPAILPVLPSAYDNTLTNLIPDLFAGLDVVSRELVGFIPAVSRNFNNIERAAVGQAVRYHVAPPGNGVNISPAMTVPEPTDQNIGSDTIVITKARAYEFGFVGEEQRGLDNNGPGHMSLQADMFAQALRGIVNEIETDLAVAAYLGASRAYGTAGTTPFDGDTSDTANLKKILDDNGAPGSERALIIDTTAGAKLRTLLGINANRVAQDQMTMQQGSLIDLHGFTIAESGQTAAHVKGTAAGATTNAAGYAVGATVITLAAAGTGTVKAGDVITFAGDANKYVVASGDADVFNGGTITLALPGLRVAIPAVATDITVSNNYTANVGFTRSAIHLAIRPPALPKEGDAAVDSMMLVDPRSGMPFEVRVYTGYRKVRYEVAAAWGQKVTKAEHVALLLG